MVGLVHIDTLRLAPAQWTALGIHAAGWLWCFRVANRGQDVEQTSRAVMLVCCLTFSGLWVAFWNHPTSVDQWLLFDQARYLASYPWDAFLEELVYRPYVDNQPPFLTFWFSRLPVLWLHQLFWFPWAVMCSGLMWCLYGRLAALLLSTPVFALIIHQPSHDVLLFGTLLIVLRLRQLGHRHLTALVYGMTWMIKPLTLLAVPFILPQLGIAGIGTLTIWGGYILWSQQMEFGRRQFRFLLQQLLIRTMRASSAGQSPPIAHLPGAQIHTILMRLWKSLNLRWRYLGCKAIKALPFYLFPAWLRPWTWRGISLIVVILLGYGNIKYFLLDLLFLFPIREEETEVNILSVPHYKPTCAVNSLRAYVEKFR